MLLTLALAADKWQNTLNIVFMLSALPRGKEESAPYLNRRMDRLSFVAKSVSFVGMLWSKPL